MPEADLWALARKAAQWDMAKAKCSECGCGLELVEATSLVAGYSSSKEVDS